MAGGVVSFQYQTNTSGATRVAHINIIGAQVTVTQSSDTAAVLTKLEGDGQSVPAGQAFPIALQVNVAGSNGLPLAGAAVTFTVTPGAGGAGGAFAATPAMPIITDQNGNATAPVLTANGIGGTFTVTAAVNGIAPVVFTLTNVVYTLGSSNIVVGSAAGSGTVLLTANGPWTASSNAPWLSVSPGSASGNGSAVIRFTYTANSGTAAQTGTVSIAGLTLTVTQEGSSYLPASTVSTLAGTGLNLPQGVAVDAAGNVYVADTANHVIKEWTAATQQVAVLVTGLNTPKSVAVDGKGNLYIADSAGNAIDEWNAGSQQLTPLVSGLNNPSGVAVDGQGNVYFSDTGNQAIKMWAAANQQVTILASGLVSPAGVAVDLLGNVYFADSGSNTVSEWAAASKQVTPLVAAGLHGPAGVAVDGQGNVYIADSGNNALKEWSAAGQVVTLASTGLSGPSQLAVDAQGNLYVADTNDDAVKRFTFGAISLSATSVTVGAVSGTGSVTAQVLPMSLPITAVSDQTWLTITNVSGGTVSFAYQANTSAAGRLAHINILGQTVTVTQSGDTVSTMVKSQGDNQVTAVGQPFGTALQVTVADVNGLAVQGVAVTFTVNFGTSGAGGTFGRATQVQATTDANGLATAPVLTANTAGGQFTVTASIGSLSVMFNLTNGVFSLGSTSVTVGSAAGTGAVLLAATAAWTASSNVPWLTLSSGSTSGSGNAVIQFSYPANTTMAAQSGTLTIAGLTFTVTQAGATYVAGSNVSTLVSTGLKNPLGVAVDTSGNVYLADSGDNAIKEWNPSSQQVTTLVSTGLNNPSAVAVDAQGNLCIADNKDNAIRKWSPATQSLTTLVSGLAGPGDVAVDGQGNVYFTDSGHNAVKEWVAPGPTVVTLVNSGLSGPRGIAVDTLGNVYFTDGNNNAVKECTASNHQVLTLVTGLNKPSGVAVDGDGNVYIADTGNHALKKWSPVSQTITSLVSTGLKAPAGLAVDSQGNVYIADSSDNAIKKFTAAYLALGFTSKKESQPAGTDSVSVQVVPANTVLTATSSQSWLSITGISGGAINFSYTANTSAAARSAQITVFGQKVTINQAKDNPASITKTAGTGQRVPVGQVFPVALQVLVKDRSGQPLQGASVTFAVTTGSSGASGTFSGATTVTTSSTGYATAPTLTANSIAGTFTVTASVSGLSATTSFTMTITSH